MPPSLARWKACRYVVAAAILAASHCGFQPRVPRNSDTVFNCTHFSLRPAPGTATALFSMNRKVGRVIPCAPQGRACHSVRAVWKNRNALVANRGAQRTDAPYRAESEFGAPTALTVIIFSNWRTSAAFACSESSQPVIMTSKTFWPLLPRPAQIPRMRLKRADSCCM